MGNCNKPSPHRKSGKRTPSGALSRSNAARRQNREESEKRSFENAEQQVVWTARRRQMSRFSEPQDAGAWRARHMEPVTKSELQRKKLDQVGSELGRMCVAGIITKAQMAAGEEYCQRYVRYAALNGLPRPTPRAFIYDEIRGGIRNRPERLQAAALAKQAHDRDLKLLRQCSAGTSWAMRQVCVLDEPAPHQLIVQGLSALMELHSNLHDKSVQAKR